MSSMAWRRGRSGRSTEANLPTTEEILLDLRDQLPPVPLVFGMPTRCPDCEDYGYIDRLDLVDRVMMLHCPTCHSRWVITEAQIDAVTAAAEAEAEAVDVDAT